MLTVKTNENPTGGFVACWAAKNRQKIRRREEGDEEECQMARMATM